MILDLHSFLSLLLFFSFRFIQPFFFIALFLSGTLVAQSSYPDIDLLRSRLIPVAEDLGLKGSSISVQSCLNKLQADGRFSDMNSKSEVLTYRILKMAQAYRTDDDFYQSKPLKEGIYSALRYWLDNQIQSSSWTARSFNEPNAGAAIGLMMWDQMQIDKQASQQDYQFLTLLEKDLIAMCNQTWTDMSHLYDPHLGANLGFRLFGMLGRAVLINHPDSVGRVHDHFLSSFEVGLGKDGQGNNVFFHVGQTPDYSWHQHNFDGGQHYWLGYGMRWIEEAIYYAERTKGTPWAFGAEQFQQLENCYLEGIQYLFYKGQGLYSVAGRDGLRDSHWSLETYVYKRLISDLKAVAGNQLNRIPELDQAYDYLNRPNDPSFSISRYYHNSDLLIQGRPNHYMALKMISTRTVGPESGNGNGKKVFHFGGGSTMIHHQGGEYDKARVGWNYRALPGITAEQKTSSLPLVDWGWDAGGKNEFAGGLDDDTLACAGFKLNRDNAYATVKANKGYFFFDQEMVCLGSNIRQTGNVDKDIWTTLNQPEWRSTVTYNTAGYQQQINLNADKQLNFTLNQPAWFHQDGIGYVVIPNSSQTQLKLWAESRTGKWSDLDGRNPSQNQSVDIFQLSINHGKDPSNDTYQYMVIPGMSASEMDSYVSNLPIAILRNSASVQAVQHKDLQTTQAIFYDTDEKIQTVDGMVIGTSKPVILMIKENSDGLQIRWADPLQSQSKVVINVNRKLNPAANILWDPVLEQSSITLDFPVGLEVGTLQEEAFGFVSEGGGTFPVVWGDIDAEPLPDQGKVQIHWMTESEEDNASFQIERSGDGFFFIPLGSMPTAGNGSARQSYAWSDLDPLEGQAFYRIRQTDLNGTYSYSPATEAFYDPLGKVRVDLYPIPARQGELIYAQLTVPDASIRSVSLMTASGEEIRRYPIPSDKLRYDLRIETHGLPAGNYFLTMHSPQSSTVRQIVILD